jgi:hypothetical protein
MNGSGGGRRQRRALVIFVAIPVACALLALGMLFSEVDGSPTLAAVASARAPGARTVRAAAGGNVGRPTLPLPEAANAHRMLSGVVLSAAGGRLRGAEVCVVESAEPCCSSRQCGQTDAEGRFALRAEPAAGSLLVSARNHVPRQWPLTARSDAELAEPLVITLELGGVELSGTVVDATGGAIAGALVAAESVPSVEAVASRRVEGALARLHAATLSDSSGAFRVRVPPGPLVVSAQADAYSRASLRLEPPFSDVTLVLAPGSEIVGRVRLASTNEPLGHVSVIAVKKSGQSAEPARAQTGVDGAFSLRGLAGGAYEVMVSTPEWRSSPAFVSVGIGEQSEPLSLFVEPAFTLSGTVLVDGELCLKGVLTASGSRSSSAPIVDGHVASVGMVGGHYDITIECDGAVPLDESIDIEREDVDRSWSLTAGLGLQGSVETASGEALAGASVSVYSVHSTGRASLCRSDAAGDFECGGLVPGEYRCTLSDAHGNEEDVVNVTVSADSSTRVVLRAAPAGTIRGRLEGAAEGQQRVYARREGGSPIEAISESGSFEFQGLQLGRYIVSSARPQERAGSDDVAVSLARDGEVVNVQLRAPGWTTIRGRVIDERAEPVVDTWVHASFADELGGDGVGDSPVAMTDGDGNFTLERLAPGNYDIVASTDRGEAILRRVQSGATDVVVQLTAYAALSGVVATATGAPVTSFELWYQRGTKRTSDRHHTRDGSWQLPWLPAGTYRVGVRSDFGDAALDVLLDPGQKATVRLTVASAAGP